jgi:hypothetical protein
VRILSPVRLTCPSGPLRWRYSVIGLANRSFRRLEPSSSRAPAGAAFADWSFSTNAPPRPGQLTVSPSTGDSLDPAGFSLRAMSSADDPEDLPLRFAFAYSNPASAVPEVLLSGPSLLDRYTQAFLPEVRGPLALERGVSAWTGPRASRRSARAA